MNTKLLKYGALVSLALLLQLPATGSSSRTSPYGSFNFLVSLESQGGDEGSELGGFSDVSGLTNEMSTADWRDGSSKEKEVRKPTGRRGQAEIILKRGKVNSKVLSLWLRQAHESGVKAGRKVVIIQKDSAGGPVRKWILRATVPRKYTGPTLDGKGGKDTAIEELVLTTEGLDPE